MSAHTASSFTALFVRRPVLALVANILIMVAGLAAFGGIEIRELPNIDQPVVSISVSYPGAAPDTVDNEVTAVIVNAAARVAGVKTLTAQSQYGQSRVTIEFNDQTDIDVAATDLKNAVDRVRGNLPDAVNDPQTVKADADSNPIMRIAVIADTLTIEELTALVDTRIADRLAAVTGVADVQIYGNREPVFLIDIDQMALAARGLTMADLESALATIAFDAPVGSLDNSDQSLVVRADARITTPEKMARVYITPTTLLSDVATVRLGPDVETSQLRVNGTNGVGIGIVRAAQSNTIEISTAVRQVVDQLARELPPGVSITITNDDAGFINGALHEVELALLIGTIVVVAVIFLFLGDLRATLIPAITIPVSLIGTLAAMWAVGFSINIITLLALVLATGLVVDDAIVVLENIMRRRALGLKPLAAAVLGTEGVFFAVLATTLTLAAVFIPISFLPGTAGALFREFGFVLAIAVLISSITALTFAPMLAAYLLPEGSEQGARRSLIGRLIDAIGAVLAGLYNGLIRLALAGPLVVVAASVVFGVIALETFRSLPRELTPREDRGSISLMVSAPQGVSVAYLGRQIEKIQDILKTYLDSGEATATFSIAGRGSSNSGFMAMTLAPWSERARSQAAISDEINRQVAKIPSVRAIALGSNSLGIRGGGQGLRFALLGPDFDGLNIAADKLIAALEKRPELANPRLDSQSTQPQLSISVDRDRAEDLGISVASLGSALQVVLEGREIATVMAGDRSIPVKLVSTATPVDDPGDLGNLFIRTGDGRMLPMSAVASISETATAPSLSRDGQQRSVPISVELAPGTALQSALDIAREVARATLSPEYSIKATGEAARLEETSSGLAITFGFAIAVIFLVLAAQFESFVAAVIIIATVPFGLAAAVFAIAFTGGSLNLYSQIGLVMLVGIMAKNGILIVEFANQRRDEGMSVRAAIETACRIRLRPVMMTMIATIVGAVPLIVATGAGAEARVALGWVLVGGLGVATVFTLFLTPAVYLLLAGLSKPRIAAEQRLDRQLEEATAPETPAPAEPPAPLPVIMPEEKPAKKDVEPDFSQLSRPMAAE